MCKIEDIFKMILHNVKTRFSRW